MRRHYHRYVCPQVRRDTLTWRCIHPGCTGIGLTWIGWLLTASAVALLALGFAAVFA